MKWTAAVLAFLLFVFGGCSNESPPDTKKEKSTPQKVNAGKAEKTEEEKINEYKVELQDLMWELDGSLKRAATTDEEGPLVMAGLMYTVTDSIALNIELMDPPEALKDKHEELLHHLTVSKAIIEPTSLLDKDEDTIYENISLSRRSFVKAQKVLSEILN